MPRGRHENHKGQSRQFTPVDQLQQELEEGLNMARSQIWIPQSPTDGNNDSSSSNENKNPARPVRGSGVHSLIKISNPNRPANPNALKRIALRKLNEEPKPLRDRTAQLNRQERESKRDRDTNEQKTQVKSDLARLALVRQEREAAAHKRHLALAAKSKMSSNTTEIKPNAGNGKKNNRYHQKKDISN